jgi:hypothetical protein
MKLYLRILRYLRPHLGLFCRRRRRDDRLRGARRVQLHAADPVPRGALHGRAGRRGGDSVFAGDSRIHDLLNWVMGDLVAGRSPMDALRNVVLVMFVVFLFKNVAAYVQQYTISVIEGAGHPRPARPDLLAHPAARFPVLPAYPCRAGDLARHHGRGRRPQLVTSNLTQAVSTSLQVVFYLTVLLIFSWQLTLVALLFLPPMLDPVGEAAEAAAHRRAPGAGRGRRPFVAHPGDGRRDPAGQGVRRGGVGGSPFPARSRRATTRRWCATSGGASSSRPPPR